MAGEATVAEVAAAEVDGAQARNPAVLAAVAGLAIVHTDEFGRDTRPEEVPDVVNHPRIQADYTMGKMHPYYPLTYRII